MLRFVVGPEGEIVPDLAGRLPGRGLWVTASRVVLEMAVAKGTFARAARGTVRVPSGLADRVEAMLARSCVGLLGIARAAGALTFGYDRVSALLARGEAGLLLQAPDGSSAGRRRLEAKAGDIPVVAALSTDELGEAVGRERVAHAAITRGRMAERLAVEAHRLAGFRQGADCGPAT